MKRRREYLEELVKEHTAELEATNQKLQQEITGRKRAEAGLRNSEELFHLITDAFPVLISYVDSEQRYRFNNKAYEEWFSHPRTEVMGKHIKEVLGEAAYKAIQKYVEAALSGQKVTYEDTIPYKDGGIRYISAIYIPHFDKKEKVRGFFALVSDITKRKQAEKELKQHRENLEELVKERTAELEAANKKLQQEISERKRTEKALRKSEERFRNLSQLAPDAIFTVNMKGTITSVNPAVLNLTRFSEDELVGRHFSKLPTARASDIPRYTKMFASLARGKVPKPFETVFYTKDGSEHRGEIHVAAIKKKGIMQGVQVVTRDITERKRAQQQIEQAAQEWRMTFDAISDMVSICDKDFKIVRVNMAFANVLKMKPQKIPGRTCYELVHGIREPWPDCPHVQTLATGEPSRAEFFEPHLGIYLEAACSPIFDEEGKTNATVHVMRDITERKQAEEALRESEEKLRLLFDSVTDGIIVTDLNGIIVDANERAVQLSGFNSKSDLIGLNNFDTIASHDRQRALDDMRDLTLRATVRTANYDLLRADGSEYPTEISAGVIKDVTGRPVGFATVIRDITERKRLEEELQKMEKLESVGILAGGIAHDFNNILTGVLGNITLAERYVEPEGKAAKRLLEARKASLKAKDLTQQLLTFARGGAPVKKLVAIARLIEDSASLALRGSNVRCDFSLPDDLRAVEADEGQMNQVITNLVINADDAMPAGGVINIRAHNTTIRRKGILPLPEGDYVEISIEDHGAGIAKKNLSKIFDPYFTTKEKGSGLGLATTYAIIKNHGGHITVESTRNVGTTFHIYLPASEKPAPLEERMAERPIRGKGRILAMDDEEMIREMLASMLPLAGYEVELTSDGAEAVERYVKAREAGKPFNAVILDLTIPGGMGGKETIQKLREVDPGVKAIASSGYATDPIMAEYQKYGFSAVVLKPYSVGALEKTLHNLLSKKDNPPA